MTDECKAIVRRKAKRIERASKLLDYLIEDTENLDINEQSKRYLLNVMFHIKPYLDNNDKEENIYNYDNFNG